MKKLFSLAAIIGIASLLFLVQGEESELREVKVPNQKIETVIELPKVEEKTVEEPIIEAVIKEEPIIHNASLISVGDIMAHTLNINAAKVIDGYDFYPQFNMIADKISSKDLAIANLETVFAGEDRRISGANMIFNAPDNLAESIKKAGFDILTTANNHSLDRGYSGIVRTLNVLDDLGISHTGTYRTEEDSEAVLIKEVNGISFAFLSYSYSTNGWPIPEEQPFCINMIDEEKIIKDIRKVKALDVDFIVVGVHWGLEYHLKENHHQRDLAEAMFYNGADIILGTHPHVLQPFEHVEVVERTGEREDKFIIYSQGNFISGQRTYPRAIGMYINFDFEKNGDSDPFVKEVSVMPTYVEVDQSSVRIIDTYKGLQSDSVSNNTKSLLETYQETFIEHVSSRMAIEPYLNDEEEFVIYEGKDRHNKDQKMIYEGLDR